MMCRKVQSVHFSPFIGHESTGLVQRAAFGLSVSAANKGANRAANRLHAAAVFVLSPHLFSFIFNFHSNLSNPITPGVG